MLVIISDLHLNDGSTGVTLAPGSLSLFTERLAELALAASWRADGAFRPIEQMDLVLLGDVLDPIRSTRWAALPDVRPWGDPQSPEFLEMIARITVDIIQQNPESLASLRGLAEEGVPLDYAPRAGQGSTGRGRPAVPVRIHYMVGNHDWFYHLPGPDYDALRQALVDHLGLANRADRPFPHDAGESDELLQVMRGHRVCARHGDIYDPMNFEGDRDASSLGDAIVIELIARFAAEVQAGLGEELPAATVLGLREIDNVRPLLLVPVWIEGLLERTCSLPGTRKRVKLVWDRLVDEFLANDFVRRHDTWSPLDLVDGLERALKFSKRVSIGWTSTIVEWLNRLRGSASGSYASHAMAEQDFRNRRARHVVYGHTHASEIAPLDASFAEGCVLEQLYFNAGTWRRIHSPAQLAPGEHEFIASDVMTYLAFFQGDERRGRPYETWFGTLGHCPAATNVQRVDAGRPPQVREKRVAVSGTAVPAPHFATLVGQGAGAVSQQRS